MYGGDVSGPTHLKLVEQMNQIVIAPARFEALATNTLSFTRLLCEQIEGKMPEHGEIFSSIPCPNAAQVLMKHPRSAPSERCFRCSNAGALLDQTARLSSPDSAGNTASRLSVHGLFSALPAPDQSPATLARHALLAARQDSRARR